jgi:hypothetical protein
VKHEELRAFTPSELLTFLKAARIGLSDADNFDALGEKLDLPDKEMARLHRKLVDFLDYGYVYGAEEEEV